MNEQPFKFIGDQKLIAMIRVNQPEDVERVVGAVKKGGIRIIEIAETVPNVFRMIELFSKDMDLLVGIGNVWNGEAAQRAINAGAKFVSSSFTSDDIISVAKNSGVLVMQGAQTPTEAVFAQHDLAADFVRIFPADLAGGPNFIKRLRGAFPFLKLVPQGEVSTDNFLDYLKSGAEAVALGNALIERSHVRAHDWDTIAERAKQFVDKLESLKAVR
ncbi:MAG: hypothetical protein HY610_04735 [Elusimicrobia bacterium]|nr:hypothetical protein [Elusimicrobiota bacterium]